MTDHLALGSTITTRDSTVPDHHAADTTLSGAALTSPSMPTPLATPGSVAGFVSGEALPGVAQEVAQEVAHWRQRCERLEATLSDLRARLSCAQNAHRDDVAAIGARLLEEAEQREWCRDYDDIIDDLNRDLHQPLPLRMRTYDVTFDLRITIRVTDVPDEDDARERAAEIASSIERDVDLMDDVHTSTLAHPDDFQIDDANL